MQLHALLTYAVLLTLASVQKPHAADSPAEAYWITNFGRDVSMPKLLKDGLTGNLRNDVDKSNVDDKNVSGKVVLPKDDGHWFWYGKAASSIDMATIDSDARADNLVLYFFEKDLHSGNKMKLHFMESKDKAKFLPVQVAKSMPFSSNKLPEILKLFSVKPESDSAKIMKETINTCEGKMSVKGEDKVCSSTLESMIDYVTSHCGNKVDVVSTYIDKETIKDYTIESAKKVGKDDANVVCHKLGYPCALFYCHSLKKTDIYSITLVDVEGKKLMAGAVCHKDTSAWNPKHLSLQLLKVKPGTVPVCHFLNEKAVAWVRKSQVM